MSVYEFDMNLGEVSSNNNKEKKENTSSIDISDIINVCREFNKLGYNIQQHIENILRFGVEESIKSGLVKVESLPHIKQFLSHICENSYFGDASEQAYECFSLIEIFEHDHPKYFSAKKN